MDEPVVTAAEEKEVKIQPIASADEKEDTQIKQVDADESLQVTPSEQPRTKSPIPSPVHIMTFVAEAGGSARRLLDSIRSKHKRGTPSSVHGRSQDFFQGRAN